ncbi:MAG TPA: ThuA domain-containing protein [Planctomycetota bacterium]|jgi:hypothetical protein
MKHFGQSLLALSLVSLPLGALLHAEDVAKKKIVFIHAGESHGYGGHSYGPAFRMFARILNESVPSVTCKVIPENEDLTPMDSADAIVLGSDAGGLVKKLASRLSPLMDKGVGLLCIHYTVDPGPKDACDNLIKWIGGAYVQNWSVNPSWEADFKTFPDHPISRGLKPFKLSDEWYYHMKFGDDKDDDVGLPVVKGLTPILYAIPPERTRQGKDGPHSGNAEVRKRTGKNEVLGWAFERADGGRGFGCTGMHEHWGWAQDSFRKCILNAIVWIAKAEVPKDGVASKTMTLEDLEADLNKPRPANFNVQAMKDRIAKMNQ